MTKTILHHAGQVKRASSAPAQPSDVLTMTVPLPTDSWMSDPARAIQASVRLDPKHHLLTSITAPLTEGREVGPHLHLITAVVDRHDTTDRPALLIIIHLDYPQPPFAFKNYISIITCRHTY